MASSTGNNASVAALASRPVSVDHRRDTYTGGSSRTLAAFPMPPEPSPSGMPMASPPTSYPPSPPSVSTCAHGFSGSEGIEGADGLAPLAPTPRPKATRPSVTMSKASMDKVSTGKPAVPRAPCTMCPAHCGSGARDPDVLPHHPTCAEFGHDALPRPARWRCPVCIILLPLSMVGIAFQRVVECRQCGAPVQLERCPFQVCGMRYLRYRRVKIDDVMDSVRQKRWDEGSKWRVTWAKGKKGVEDEESAVGNNGPGVQEDGKGTGRSGEQDVAMRQMA